MSQDSIVVLGGINLDLVVETERMPEPGESMIGTSLSKLSGGKGANTAVAAYRACHMKPNPQTGQRALCPDGEENEIRVYLNGAVGNDDFGARLLQKLSRGGIDVSQVQVFDGEETATAIVIVGSISGENSCIAYRGAIQKWTFGDPSSIRWMAGGLMPSLVICHLSIVLEEVQRVLEKAYQEGVETILNPSPSKTLDRLTYRFVNHLIMNQSEAAMLYGCKTEELEGLVPLERATDYFLNLGVQNVVITLGDRGAFYATCMDKGLVGAEKKVNIVDSTGAGDTFIGTYAVNYIQQRRKGAWEIRKAIERACKASARTTERLGAQESIPWADEVDFCPTL